MIIDKHSMNMYLLQTFNKMERTKEENAIVLDFLSNGYPLDERPMYMKTPIAQAMGKEHFVLLELVPQKGIELKPHDEIYIGDGPRDKISYIKGVLSTGKLTQTAKNELPHIVKELVEKNEERFVDFFNNSGPISLRAHQLELLPGIGKRHAQELLKAREAQPFSSFSEIKKRVSSIPEPKKLVIQRILFELEDGDRYKLFVRV